MLRIKPEQLEHFADLARGRFVAMMTRFVRDEFPDHQAAGARVASMSAEALTSWVRSGLAFCERAGVTTEPEAAQLVLLLLVLGVDADERVDWLAPIVERRDLSPEGKVRSIVVAAREAGLPIDDVVRYPQYEAPNESLPAPSELSEA